jgi:hypothetical protein
MDKRTFWASKSPRPEFHCVTFAHPAFDAPIRLVANQFAAVTVAGNTYQPVPMTIKPPEQKGDAQPKLSLSFPRQVVGREFKRQLSKVSALTTLEPITVLYAVYLDGVTEPAITWPLYVSDASGVAFNATSVTVTASDDNPMRRSVAPIYDPAIFTGLEVL